MTPPDPLPPCCEQVRIPRMYMPRYRQCTNPAKVTRNGQAYCGLHDPIAKAERAARLEPKKGETQRRRMAAYLYKIGRRLE